MRNVFEKNEFIPDCFDDYIERDSVERERAHEMMAAIAKDMMNKKAGGVIPDTTGADKYFIDGFLTYKMRYDFWVIARDFMAHHFERLGEFEKLASYRNGESRQSDPEKALQIRILSVIYKAAKAGDPYSADLIKKLYRTYHGREYKQLKRFREISVSEIFSIAKNEFGEVMYDAVGRVLGMCVLYGIQIEEKCSALYVLMGDAREKLDRELEPDFYDFPEGVYQECLEQVDEWILEESEGKQNFFRSYAKHFRRVEDFVARCLERFGYPDDFVYLCDRESCGIKEILAQTLALLKSVFPKREFTFEEVQQYAHIYKTVSALISVCDTCDENLNELFGIAMDRHELDGTTCLFKPEAVERKTAAVETPILRPINVAPTAKEEIQETDYLQEIANLRKRLHEKEQESRQFRMQYEQTRQALKEAKESIAKYENDREELIALRNHVYNLAEEVAPVEEKKLVQMKQEIAKRNIAIVGGHVNWVNKVKKEFPDWKFLDANISRMNDAIVLDGTEMLYFFSSHLSHGTYGKFVAAVREKDIPFGYIHSVNLDVLVKQVYRDMQ